MVRFLRKAVFLMILLPAFSIAQTATKQYNPKATLTALPANQPAENTEATNIVEPYDGTYRFIFTKGIRQAFTTDIFEVIDKNRKENEEVTLVLSEYCKLQVLSRKQITAPGFIPFTQSFIFE